MKISKIIFSIVLMLCFGMHQIQSQNESSKKDSLAVHKVIIDLFDGMREGDSTKVRNTFHKDVIMLTTYNNKDNINVLEKGSLIEFLHAIASPHPKIYDEKIWNTTIQIDDTLAQVWTDYAFYVGAEFSHCGVDAFQLIKDANEEWKIIHLIDTRRKEGCTKI
ncbi:MAG: nuclear transport factor 2 family protein [Flavobacteriaceae bacterium]|nr:nuclear transport factor 2 family protein [Flavobacteriaceae bacterium]